MYPASSTALSKLSPKLNARNGIGAEWISEARAQVYSSLPAVSNIAH